MTTLYLASQSPRRRELLAKLNGEFECLSVDIDETWNGHEAAIDYVLRLAREKAQAARVTLDMQTEAVIIAADTIVVIDNEILGKPETKDNAVDMLLKLSGKTHEVYTAVCLLTNIEKTILNKNLVSFISLTTDECQAYVDSGEPMDKAGAYAIQGKAAAFIKRVEGSYSGIMGLPLREIAQLLDVGDRF